MLTKEERIEIHQKYGGRCAYCGAEIKLKGMQVDHIHAKYLGGEDVLENFNPSCRSCNNRKQTFSIEGFRKELEMAHERLLRDCTTYRIANRFGLVGELKHSVKFYFEEYENVQ